MPDFEDLRLKDLVIKFRAEVVKIMSGRNLSDLKQAGARLQDAYDFFITASKDYAPQQENLKNAFSSFNYAAVIVNAAIKNGGLGKGDGQLLDECLQIMIKCSDNIIGSLNGNNRA